MNRVTLRKINELNVLREIFNNAPTSRGTVAKNLNLTKSTVYSIFTKLENDALIYDIGQGSSTNNGGRKPALTNFNGRVGYTINTRINEDTISCMVNWLDGSVISFQEFPVMGNDASQRLLSLYQAIKSSKVDRKDLLGISVAIYGIVRGNHVVSATITDLSKFDLVQILQSRFNVPVVLGNEANMSAIYIKDYTDKNKLVRNAISLSLSDGMGAGIIINGQLYTGAFSEAGEVGHALYYMPGQVNPVRIQDISSDSAIFKRLSELKHNTVKLTDIKRWYDSGDQQVEQILNEFCIGISMVLQNLLLSFDPEQIVISSRVIRVIPELLKRINNSVKPLAHEKPPIILSDNVNQSALLGGCALISRQILGFPSGKLIFKKRSAPQINKY